MSLRRTFRVMVFVVGIFFASYIFSACTVESNRTFSLFQQGFLVTVSTYGCGPAGCRSGPAPSPLPNEPITIRVVRSTDQYSNVTSSDEVSSCSTDAQGTCRIVLSPGNYVVCWRSSSNCGNATTVPPHQFVNVHFGVPLP